MIASSSRCTAGPPATTLPLAKEAVAAVEVGDDPARLAHHQDAGADIPGREAELEEAVVDAGRRIGEVEGGRAAAADGLRQREDVAEDAEIEVEGRQGAPGIAGGEERALQAVLPETRIGRPFQVAPPPRTAEKRFSPSGSAITPTSSSSPRRQATETQ